ncbi:hypothetical protein P43SY_009097 [Pythium insidiosum]|uniref:Glyceraldehyde 3-phosphate dehydrogenase catalytic domain-containing protein n=1 Tax=Pythium insidiosum TaxID=114742 RepID=A0AAD5LT28_PYTIN|nr:hypothetical protein P43SY_009097 [Pythium insidiosum]
MPAAYEQIKVAAIKKVSESELKGILDYTADEVPPNDFLNDKNSSVFNANAGISLNDNFVKLISCHDKEWSYYTTKSGAIIILRPLKSILIRSQH